MFWYECLSYKWRLLFLVVEHVQNALNQDMSLLLAELYLDTDSNDNSQI